MGWFVGCQGNDEGEQQALWENPLDVKPLMTAEDHERIGKQPFPAWRHAFSHLMS
jgi:hypothetical protein